IIKCLRKEKNIHIIAADAKDEVVGKYLADDFLVIPPASDSKFSDKLLSLCRERNIHVLLPLVTKELIPLADRMKEFELAGTRIPISSVASLEIANNKSRLYEFLQWRGMAIPDFRVVENVEQFKTAITELGYPDKIVCFKPSVSNGSRGFRILSEQQDELDLLFNHKPTTTYLKEAEAIRILSSGLFPELLVSEYLPGAEYSVDCLCDHGEAILVVPRIRTKMINGISVQGQFIQQEEIIRYCNGIIKELHLHGNIGIQVKANESGEYMILEINPRVQGSISAGLGAGVNLPVLAIKQELGLTILPEETFVKWGTRFTRFWDEIFY
ncbi:MAG TPA: ATP-grasp domain-containing protein, partial [Chitinophagaceae bacterium]|nr:ATP-grasp domain-containing protein [Chitinophagaceae bacterium]